MEIRKRKSINDDLIKYDYLAKEHDFIEVTEWINGEGYDVTVNDNHYSFTEGTLDAINYLILSLRYDRS